MTRAAKSLIELVTVMAIFSVVLLLAARMLVLVLHADTSGAQGVAESLNVSRMARQFRQDVHAATAARLDEPEPAEPQRSGGRLVLEFRPKRTVTWTAEAERIVRTVYDDDKRVAVESYELSRGDNDFALNGDLELVTLTHRRAATAGREARSAHAVRVAAVRGRDIRFGLVEPSPEEIQP